MAKRIQRRIVSPQTKYKMSLAHKGNRNGMFGKHHSNQAKAKISKKLKEYWDRIPVE